MFSIPPVWLIVAGVTAVGGALRLWNLEAAQFRADDFVVSSLALDIVQRGQWPTGVLSSIGIDNGPAAPILLAIPALISDHHQWLSVWVGLLNTAMIPVSFLVGRRLFGPQAGVMAAVLTAVNPWLVVYGRRLWLNAFLAPAALAFLWALCWATTRPRLLPWVVAGATLGASAQIHLSSIPNLLAYSSLLLFRRPSRLLVLIGGAVATLLLVPWIALSLAPDLMAFDWTGARPATIDSGASSLERATIVVTGVAYQSVVGQGGRLIDATALPFAAIDAGARALAVAGWALLVVVGWRQRSSAPASAAACAVMAFMVAAPTLLLLRPAQAGQLPFLYPYYFLNLIPPLLLGMGAAAALLSGVVPHLGKLVVAVIATSQLALAGPFFATHEEFWPLGDYGVPWKYTDALVQTAAGLARSEGAPILVGGQEVDDSEQASVTARLLARVHTPVRLYDSRDGVVYRAGPTPTYQVTTNDEHVLARMLRRDFSPAEVVTQQLPGAGWNRRIYRLDAQQIDDWAMTRLPLRPTDDGSGQRLAAYERAGFVSIEDGSPHRLGVLWRLDADPEEPFFTDVILLDGDLEIGRQTHVAYPAHSWQRGDWTSTRILNLFELAGSLVPTERTTIRFEHRGVLTGRRASPPTTMIRPL